MSAPAFDFVIPKSSLKSLWRGRNWPCPNVRVMKGKVSSHDFAFSPADTKLSGFVGLFGRETGMLSRGISPFGNSTKSKWWFSSRAPGRKYAKPPNPAFSRSYFALGVTDVW
jgi:hypothetical protein